MSILRDVKLNDCPNCGKKASAFMGSSEWGHNVMCCSETCGLAVKKRIEENTNMQEYRDIKHELDDLTNKLYRLKYKGLKRN